MRWKTTIDSEAVDVDLLRATVPLLLERLRALAVSEDHLVHPDTGSPIVGLRVVRGSHPRTGTQYEANETIQRGMRSDLDAVGLSAGGARDHDDRRAAAFLRGARSDGLKRTTLIELVTDDSKQFRLMGAERGEAIWTFTIDEPRRSTTMAVEIVTPSGTAWITRGELTMNCSIDLDELADSTFDDAAPVRWSLVHRRFRARGDVNVETTVSGWRLHLDLRARGRGVLRPLGPLVGWISRRALDDGMEGIADDLTPLVAAMRAHPTPDALADHWLSELLQPYVEQQ